MPDLRPDREQRRVIIGEPLQRLRTLHGGYVGDESFRWTPAINGAVERYLALVGPLIDNLREDLGDEKLARIVARELPELVTEEERIAVRELRARCGETFRRRRAIEPREALRVVREAE